MNINTTGLITGDFDELSSDKITGFSSLNVSGNTLLNNVTINGTLNISGLNVFNNFATLNSMISLNVSGDTIINSNTNNINLLDKTKIDSNGLEVLNTSLIPILPPILSNSWMNVRDTLATCLNKDLQHDGQLTYLSGELTSLSEGLPTLITTTMAATITSININVTSRESAFDKQPPLYLDTSNPTIKPILKINYDYNFSLDSNNNLTIKKNRSIFYFTLTNTNIIILNGVTYYKYDINIDNYTNKILMEDNATYFRKFKIFTWITNCEFNDNLNSRENEYSIFMSYRTTAPSLGLHISANNGYYGFNKYLTRIFDHTIISNDFNNLTYISNNYNINIGCIINSNF